MKKFLGILSDGIKRKAPLFAKLLGVNMLTREETVEKLMSLNLFYADAKIVELEAVKTWDKAARDFENPSNANLKKIGVYSISGDNNKVKIFKHGGMQINRDVLSLDFGNMLFLKTVFKKDDRQTIAVENCLSVWSHYWGGGYFDFLFFILAKTLRITSVLDTETLKNIKIAYPLFNTSYEKELWKIAGFTEDQFIDTRKYKVKAKTYYIGNTHSWYYIQPYDVKMLQGIMANAGIKQTTGSEFIYVSRKGRRVLTNEEEMIDILKSLNFTILKDEPRTVVEQMTIFNNAKVIIGPHGAAFANTLWCKPGTHLIELFPKSYFPPYYRFLSKVLGLKYAAIFEENVGETHFSGLNDDLYIEASRIKKALEETIAEVEQKQES